MKRKWIGILAILVIFLIVAATVISCMARFVFLSPSCYSDHRGMTEWENYFIKKTVLQAVEDRLSVFAKGTNDIYDSSATDIEVVQLDESQNHRKHMFVLINTDFMDSVTKENGEYRILVQTYYMESASDDCVYEIHVSEDFFITFFGLNP